MAKPKMDAAIVCADLGNSAIKGVYAMPNGRQYETAYTHALFLQSDAEWSKAQNKAKHGGAKSVAKTQSFSVKTADRGWLNATVGDGAQDTTRTDKVSGSYKYDPYYTKILVSSLLMMLLEQAFPEGHDNVVLSVGIPMSEYEFVDRLVQSAGGTYLIKKPNGAKVKFVVRAVIPWEEPLGGMARFVSRNQLEIPAGKKVIIVDVGGRIGAIGRMVSEDGVLKPLPNTFWPIENGILVLFDNLKTEMKSAFSNDMYGAKNIPEYFLAEAVKDKRVSFRGGEPVDVSAQVRQAATILPTIDAIYRDQFNSGLTDHAILLTGGGSGVLYNDLEPLFQHRNVYAVDDLETIYMANARGAVEITMAALAHNNQMPSNYARVWK